MLELANTEEAAMKEVERERRTRSRSCLRLGPTSLSIWWTVRGVLVLTTWLLVAQERIGLGIVWLRFLTTGR